VIYQINIILQEKLSLEIQKRCLELILIHTFLQWFPIKIPESVEEMVQVDLYIFQMQEKCRLMKLVILLVKHSIKKYASKEGLEKFSCPSKKKITLEIISHLLFIGNTTLHTNHPVFSSCSSYRLTLLAHFFDPSPKYGVGSLLRLIRNR